MIAAYAALAAALIIAILGGIVLLLPDRAERADRSFDAHTDQALAVGNEPAAVDELAARRTSR